MLEGDIDFDSQYGQLIKIVLESKRKDPAMKNVIFARGCLEGMIKELELENAKRESEQKDKDALAIDSTCVTVSVSRNENAEVQLQLNDIPKKIGRPKKADAMSGAERAKKARDKKKANKLVTVNATLSQHASELYNQMISSGYDLSSIIEMAHNQAPLGDKAR